MRSPIAHLEGETSLRLDDGVPARLVWAGRRWRVSDTPSRLHARDMYYLGDRLTHLPDVWLGWRFQAHPDDGGEARVFDVIGSAGRWSVAHVFD